MGRWDFFLKTKKEKKGLNRCKNRFHNKSHSDRLKMVGCVNHDPEEGKTELYAMIKVVVIIV